MENIVGSVIERLIRFFNVNIKREELTEAKEKVFLVALIIIIGAVVLFVVNIVQLDANLFIKGLIVFLFIIIAYFFLQLVVTKINTYSGLAIACVLLFICLGLFYFTDQGFRSQVDNWRKNSNSPNKEVTTQTDSIAPVTEVDDKVDENEATHKSVARSVNSKLKPEVKFFSGNSASDVAILRTGDRSHKDLGASFGKWLAQQGYKVNTGMFLPAFQGTYQSRLRNKDIDVFKESGADKITNCVCQFDQNSKLEESTLAGEKFITAIFSGVVTVFDFTENTQNTFEINVRGAGITIDRAMESVEEKLQVEYESISSNFSGCR